MKLSLAVPSFEDSSSLEDLDEELKKIASWGYEAVEPMVCNPTAIDAEKIEELLRRCKLKLSGFRTGLAYQRDGLNFSSIDPLVRKQAIKRIWEVIDLASRFPGAALLNGLIQGRLQEEVVLKQAKIWIEDALRKCCSRAEEKNVKLCLEPVNRYEIGYHNTLQEVSEMVDKVGSSMLLVLIDTFHMNIEEVNICDSIHRFAEYIGHLHLADSNRMAPGKGHLDFHSILNALKEIGYEGYITVEMGPQKDFHSAAEYAAHYLYNLIEYR